MSDFLDKIQQTQSQQTDKELQDSRVKAIIDAIGAKVSPKEVRLLGSSIDKLNSALQKMGDISLDVKTDEELKAALGDLAKAVSSIEVNPIVKVPEPQVVVKDNPVDLAPVISQLKSLESAIKANKQPAADNSDLKSAVDATTEAINALRFPVANYILPFKNNRGEAAQVQLDPSGNVPISGSISVDTTGLATSTKQSDGTQKTQVVDGSGNVIGATSNALDVNIKSGAASGTQYADGAARGTGTGTLMMVDDGVNIQSAAGTSGGVLKVDLSGTAANGTAIKVDGSGVTQPVSLASVPSHAVTNAGTFAVQATEADGANTTLGAKADAKSTATDTTAVSAMSVLKQISASVQAPPSQAVTNTGTFAVQATIAASATNIAKAEDAAHVSGDTGVPFWAVRNDLLATTFTDTNGDYSPVAVTSTGRMYGSVIVDSALPAGSNLLGKVGIDQTTPGTTNLVALAANQSVNNAQINGVTPLMGNGTSGTGAQRVTIASDSTGQVAPAANATSTGLSMSYQNALTNTKVAVNASAGNFYGYHIYNPGSVVTYIQLFNVASASVTLGTTTPNMVIAVPPGGWADAQFTVPISFGTALTVAATTTTTGLTAPATSLNANFFYK